MVANRGEYPKESLIPTHHVLVNHRMYASGFLRPVFRANAWLDQHAFGITTLILVLYFVGAHLDSIFRQPKGRLSWDVMLFSGSVACMIGLYYVRQIDDRMMNTIHRLIRRGAFYRCDRGESTRNESDTASAGDDRNYHVLSSHLRKRADTASCRIGLLVSVAMYTAFLPYNQVVGLLNPLVVMEVAVAYVAGRFLGRMAAYGRLGKHLRECDFDVKVQPGHPDETAGLKPVGDFYFYQAKILAIPAAYLGIWLIILTLYSTPYGYWQIPYLFLLFVSLILANVGFVVPLASFHKSMKKQKAIQLDVADQLSRLILKDKALLRDPDLGAERETIENRLAATVQQYRDIERMPTFPLDVSVRRKYGFGNLILTLPIASFVANSKDPLNAIGGWLQNVVQLIAS